MQEVIFIKNFNKQNQTKVDQAADTNWAIKNLQLFLLFWKHTVRAAYPTFAEYLFSVVCCKICLSFQTSVIVQEIVRCF